MALRVKTVEVGGRKFRIGNLQRKALRVYRQALDAITAKRPDARHTDDVTEDVIIASIARAGGSVTHEDLGELDNEDLLALWREVMAWTSGPDVKPEDIGKPADPPASP